MVPSHLVELGQQALATVTANVEKGEPLVRCQLLALEFYEALKRELQATSELDAMQRAVVVAAANQCRRAASASISPGVMLVEFRRAIALLRLNTLLQEPEPSRPEPKTRPVLRVIEGGKT